MKSARTPHREGAAPASVAPTSAVRRARGMLADIQPERRLSDELIAERRAEARLVPVEPRASR